ncbi:MAG: Rpn family recombination-promoting nuclease/putative transposase [Bacillus sp. (in: Bacteria)]|nr:Rpn family recombination-promoting nuclease/putative transposase [Bacillus sp. (in: firmicutes)]MCM1426536.1 Rpn family recombination-promoting nuclease/putative transposase [Eubacterium sp.]
MQITKQKKKQNAPKENKAKRHAKVRFRWLGRHEDRKVHRQIKDRLFRFLFEKDKEALLQLYNALNGTNYTDVSMLQVVTIESAVYVVMKNDLAFVMAGTLNLYEHQSTYNSNMPVRFFIYLAEEYQKLLEQAKDCLYGTKQITLPVPQCIVFYNGERDMPEEQILRLSDAFAERKRESAVELQVRMLNINYGHQKELMEKCKVLREYAEFVDIARHYAKAEETLQKALNAAINYCISHHILEDFLKKYRAEVLGMLLEEFDVDKYERTLREEGREEGLLQVVRINQLTDILLEQNRITDLKRAVKEPEYQQKLLKELNL